MTRLKKNMNNSMKFLVDTTYDGERLDVFLSEKINNFSRSYLKKIIEKDLVKVNNLVTNSPSKNIKTNDSIEVRDFENKTDKLIPKKIKLEIIFEDKDILVIDKPKGMVVHPGAGNLNNTLANALSYKYRDKLSNINGNLRPGIVHRIDKETSGLLVIAKNNKSHFKLSEQFSDHSIVRKYQCLIWGILRPLNGRIETLISRSKKNRKLMSVSENAGKKAITNYKTIKIFALKNIPKISLIECNLETGRTHQIRVHLSHKGSSIIGDKQYGKKNIKFKKIDEKFFDQLNNIDGQILHAGTLEFIHPSTNEKVSFQSKIPSDFKKLLKMLNNLSG